MKRGSRYHSIFILLPILLGVCGTNHPLCRGGVKLPRPYTSSSNSLASPGGLWDNNPHMARWILFLIVVLLGGALGLVYGWVVNPVEYVDTTPGSLREDYKADYVLMVAESYHANGDVALAARRLALLGGPNLTETISQAMVFGGQAGYAEDDLELMARLASDMQAWDPMLELGGP